MWQWLGRNSNQCQVLATLLIAVVGALWGVYTYVTDSKKEREVIVENMDSYFVKIWENCVSGAYVNSSDSTAKPCSENISLLASQLVTKEGMVAGTYPFWGIFRPTEFAKFWEEARNVFTRYHDGAEAYERKKAKDAWLNLKEKLR